MPSNGNRNESGNIFFTLFGAVALVGVIGASTATLIRGPLSTVSAVNQKAKADSQMQIASKLAMIRASQQPGGGNCDMDAYVEPVPPDMTAAVAPVGGGGLPTTFGASQIDPWGTRYGYCVWDLGVETLEAGCTAQGTRLAGGDDRGQPVMVIISAGANRAFETECQAWADNTGVVGPVTPSNAATLINKPATSDDIIVAFTYDDAVTAADGLWSIKPTDPTTITTDRNVEFASGNVDFTAGTTASFQGSAMFQSSASFMPGSRLDLGGGGLFLLPDQIDMPDGQCTAANNGVLRLNTAAAAPNLVLEMCDVAVPGFVAIGGAGTTVGAIDDLSDAIADATELSLFMGAGSGVAYSSATGAGTNLGIGINAAGSLTTGGNNLIIGHNSDVNNGARSGAILLGNNLTATANDMLNIGDVIFGSNMYSSSSGRIGIGAPSSSAKLDVDGEVEATRFQFGGDPTTYFGYAASTIQFNVSGVTEATLDAGGLFVADDIEADGNVYGNSFRASAAGTDALPAFTFEGNGNTGMFDDGGNLAFTVNGDQMVTISTNDMNVDGDGIFNGYVRGDSFNFNASTNTGLYYASGGNMTLNMGGSSVVYIAPTGRVGIGASNPSVELDVSGAIRPADTVAACGAGLYGAIKYASGDVLQMCSELSGDWETIGTSGGGGSGSGSYWTRISAGDPRLYYNPGFVGIGTADPLTRLHVSGTFSATGSYTGSSTYPISGAGARFFFEPTSGATRGGSVSGAQWDSANIGMNSTAFGSDTRASGAGSVALGNEAEARGDNSFAFGLGNPAGAAPQVTGLRSFGIFMGDQTGVNIATNNLMALLGGRFIIDPDQTSATNLVPSGLLTLDVEGDVGAIQYCDNNGANCFTAADIASGSTGAPGNDREIVFNSGNALWTDTNFVFTSAGRLGIGTTAPVSGLDVNTTDAVTLSRGTDAQRPAGTNGMIRYNTTNNRFEVYQAGQWRDLLTEDDGSFIALTDTPATYASAGQLVRINATEDGLEFFDITVADLTDVDLTGLGGGDVLIYDAISGNWEATPMSALTPDAAGPDRAVQFKSGTGFFGTSNLTFTATGELGIGTDTPAALLEARRDQAGFTGVASRNDTNDPTSVAYIGAASATSEGGVIAFPSNYAVVHLADRVGVGALSAFPSILGRAASGLTLFSEDPAGDINFFTGGTSLANERMRITAAGNVGIGTDTPQAQLDIAGTGAVLLTRGTTAQRPASPVNGMIRYNSENDKFEGYEAGAWVDLIGGGGGASALDDLSDATTNYSSSNVFIGQNAGLSITEGDYNLAVGSDALRQVSNGSFHTAIGINALRNIGGGFTYSNTAVGSGAGHFMNSGSGNVMVGAYAMGNWDGGSNNVAIGNSAMNALNGSGDFNVAVGSDANSENVGGLENVAVGASALRTNVANSGSTAVGFEAMRYANSDAMGVMTYNTAIGYQALMGSTTAASNTGTANTAIGHSALIAVTSGSGNVAIGDRAADNLTTGSNNIIIGSNIDALSATGSNQLNIGGVLFGDTSDGRISIGAAPVAGVELYVSGDIEYTGTLTDVSDRRLKTDIHPLRQRGSMLDKLGALETYSFRMKDDPAAAIEYGVMAQEMIEHFPELVRVDDSAEGYMSVNYIGLIAPIIEATKELKTENDTLRAQVQTMEQRLAMIEGDLKGMKAHTGYGIGRAGFDTWVMVLLAGLAGAGGAVTAMVGMRRRRGVSGQ